MVEQTNIVHSGELYKQAVSSSLKNWKWRTITLTPTAIAWGKKDGTTMGKLDLTTDTVVTTETGVSTWYTGYQLKITTPAGALVLYSSSEGIRDHWVAVIENTVKALNRPELLKRGSAIVAGLFGGAKDHRPDGGHGDGAGEVRRVAHDAAGGGQAGRPDELVAAVLPVRRQGAGGAGAVVSREQRLSVWCVACVSKICDELRAAPARARSERINF